MTDLILENSDDKNKIQMFAKEQNFSGNIHTHT